MVQKNFKVQPFSRDWQTAVAVHTVFQDHFSGNHLCIAGSWDYMGLLMEPIPECCKYAYRCRVHETGSHVLDVDKLLMATSFRAAPYTYSIICAVKVPVRFLEGSVTSH